MNETKIQAEAVAIIGMSVRLPGAENCEQFWDNLKNGVESISRFSEEELKASGLRQGLIHLPNYVKARGTLKDLEFFDGSFFGFTPREAEITDPQHRILLECAWEALESAGYDPLAAEGDIGVFAGAGLSYYLLSNLLPNTQLSESTGTFKLLIGNDKDFINTRISYKLNLKGPSLNINTACSTSLTAVHMACRSLLSYECDMALAGGASVTVPQKSGYLFIEGGIESPDGYCRAFDASAQGTVSSNGAGMVLLKRLSEAITDNDSIYAVIKGSAVNNDGSVKVGFTAPSLEGQAKVIAEALLISETDPNTIDYIETHGTGTQLGDPIEIGALRNVFRKRPVNNKCALGGVKTNIGHVGAAAGIAGLIKAVMALHHAIIPPTLHFKQPNPKIELQATPFYVPNELVEWPRNGHPRRAGVSSFGIGGTNAHVIIEEAPAGSGKPSTSMFHLFPLAGKTETALQTMAFRLAGFLERHSDMDLADTAYTLQTGRRPFSYRGFVVCGQMPDAIHKLRQELVRGISSEVTPKIIFLFPGQGTQYVDMGKGLYETVGKFREVVDHCARLLQPLIGLDLRTVLYPREAERESAARKIKETQITQPALFVVEYALAEMWRHWGVKPEAMIGHSLGEYVAACIAEVFSLENGLTLVATRAKLMQNAAPGAMLFVRLPESDVTRLLKGTLCLAAVNAPRSCVVSGSPNEISTLEKELAQRAVECKVLETSHAFHSVMMDTVIDPYRRVVRTVKMGPPRIPYISNVTGTWIQKTEAADPEYWVKHLRCPVQFNAGISELLRDGNNVLLEVGPGQVLGGLARQAYEKSSRNIFSTLRREQDPEHDGFIALAAAGRLWASGAAINWGAWHADGDRKRIALPTYPFEKKRCWIDPPGQASSAVPHEAECGTSEGACPPNANSTPAAGQVEEVIAGIWEELMGITGIGKNDDFFVLGGDSLLATQVLSRCRSVWKVSLAERDFFAQPTIAHLVELVTNGEQDKLLRLLEQIKQLSPDEVKLQLEHERATSAKGGFNG
jgi:acyl transferase domain-containing protein